MIKHKMQRVSWLANLSLLVVWALAAMLLFAPSASATPIADTSEAAEVCRSQFPNGSASANFNYCAYTAPGATTPCVVASAGSFPDFGETCVTLPLDSFVGNEPENMVALANLGGGTSTQPDPSTQPSSTTSAASNAPTTCKDNTLDRANCPAIGYLIDAINIVSAAVVIIITGSIIYAGIQYSSSRDDPQAISKAKHRILQAVIALVLYIFGYGILQWLVPGGLFS